MSADRTSIVLDKSASFQGRRSAADRERPRSPGGGAGGGLGIGGGGPGSVAAGGGSGGAGPYQSFAPLEDLINSVVAEASGLRGSVQRKGVLPMLQPEYISTPKLARWAGILLLGRVASLHLAGPLPLRQPPAADFTLLPAACLVPGAKPLPKTALRQ
jgi:hypothetical protein